LTQKEGSKYFFIDVPPGVFRATRIFKYKATFKNSGKVETKWLSMSGVYEDLYEGDAR
jgi:hypothetical protein